jgi:hypothetical protein
MREPSRERGRRRTPTRGDIVVLVILALLVAVSHRLTLPRGVAATLVVQSESGTRRIDAGQNVDVQVRGPLGISEVRLQDRTAWIERAPCRNRLCQQMGRVRAPGRSLVCIPNKVIVHFAGGASEAQTDAITR